MAHDRTSQDVQQLRMARMRRRSNVSPGERALRERAVVGQALEPDAIYPHAYSDLDKIGYLAIVLVLYDEIDLQTADRSAAPDSESP